MLLTIFTPTFNRRPLLQRLYDSLCAQSCKDFEWLVVDDGSDDGTDKFISDLISERKVPIKLIRKDNGGKHTAHNTALKYAQGDYFFTVDSDDWLPEDSVLKIKHIIESNRAILDSNDIAGFLALKSLGNGQIISSPFSKNKVVSSIYDLNHNGDRGERSILFKREVIKQYLFPVIAGERFMTESVIYDRIDQLYKFLVINEALTVCEYQAEGLSSNPKRLMYNYPGGYIIYFMQRANYSKHLNETIKYLIQANCFIHIYNGKQPIYSSVKYPILKFLLKPLGWLAAFHYMKYAR